MSKFDVEGKWLKNIVGSKPVLDVSTVCTEQTGKRLLTCTFKFQMEPIIGRTNVLAKPGCPAKNDIGRG